MVPFLAFVGLSLDPPSHVRTTKTVIDIIVVEWTDGYGK